MATFIQEAAYAASQSLKNSGLPLKRSQVLEVVAASLGYRTFSALAAENADRSLDYHLEDATFVVLNVPMAERRVHEMAPASSPELAASAAKQITDAIVAAFPDAFLGIQGFWNDHLEEVFVEAMSTSDETYSAQAESNADFPDDVELDDGCPKVDDLWAAKDVWTIATTGTMTGSYDPDGDRMYTGDSLNCWAKLTFRKAGRAGLVEEHCETGAGQDDSWRDLDREDECASIMLVVTQDAKPSAPK